MSHADAHLTFYADCLLVRRVRLLREFCLDPDRPSTCVSSADRGARRRAPRCAIGALSGMSDATWLGNPTIP